MASTMEILGHRLTALIAVITLGGFAVAVLDTRHASASDVRVVADMVHQLVKTIQKSDIAQLEYKIEDTEDQINRAESVPAAIRPSDTGQYIQDLENKKARYIRKLERLNNE